MVNKTFKNSRRELQIIRFTRVNLMFMINILHYFNVIININIFIWFDGKRAGDVAVSSVVTQGLRDYIHLFYGNALYGNIYKVCTTDSFLI